MSNGAMMMEAVNVLVWRPVLFILLGGSVVAVLLGIGLLVAPDRVRELNAFLGRWVDTEKMERAFDRPRWSERFFYRHHRIVGGLLCAGGCYVIYVFLLSRARHRLAVLSGRDLYGFFDAGIAILVIGGTLAAFLGLVMYAKPSVLRDLEKAANRWISTDWARLLFNRSYSLLDESVFQYRKTAALVLIATGMFVAVTLARLLFIGNWRL